MRTLLALAVVSTASAADGWEELLVSGEKTPWKKVDANWIFAADAKLESKAGKLLDAVDAGKGGVWINGPKGRLANLGTKKNYRDCEVHVEFMMGKGSNSGIKFHAVYEIQFRDSADKKTPLTGDDMGGIYPRAEEKPTYHHMDDGIPPKLNAAKPAGEWQTLDVVWRSPRFDAEGKKIEHAKIIKATLNDKVIHENVELQWPTGSNHEKKETAEGPFMLQTDHGPIAWRNVKIREVKN